MGHIALYTTVNVYLVFFFEKSLRMQRIVGALEWHCDSFHNNREGGCSKWNIKGSRQIKNQWISWTKSMTPTQENTILFRSFQQLPHLRHGSLKAFMRWHGALQGPLTHLVHCACTTENQGDRRCFKNWKGLAPLPLPCQPTFYDNKGIVQISIFY